VKENKMSNQTREARLVEIRADYRPYDTLPAFDQGFADYQNRLRVNPYDGLRGPGDGLKAQAWDRGANAAMRYNRFLNGLEKPEVPLTRKQRTPEVAAALDDATEAVLARIAEVLRV
jgi:hypothetical protein